MVSVLYIQVIKQKGVQSLEAEMASLGILTSGVGPVADVFSELHRCIVT